MKLQIIRIPTVGEGQKTFIRLVDGDNYMDFTLHEAMNLYVGLRDAMIDIQKKMNEEADEEIIKDKDKS